jgi:hypothetical protein
LEIKNIQLNNGQNTIKLIKNGNDDQWVELDAIMVVPPLGATYEPDVKSDYEAEEGTVLGGAMIIDNTCASNGKYVDLPTIDSGLVFSYIAYIPGNYKLKIYYMAPLKNASLEVLTGTESDTIKNSFKKIAFNEAPGSFKSGNIEEDVITPAVAHIVVEFQEGINYIKLVKTEANDKYVQIDKVLFEKTDLPINDFTGYDIPKFDIQNNNSIKVEAEESSLLGKNPQIRSNKNTSGEFYIGKIDEIGDGIEFILNVETAGEYTIESFYLTDMPLASHDLFINGKYINTFQYKIKTGWGSSTNYTFVPAGFIVQLKEGENIVRVEKGSTNISYAELDYIKFTKGNIAPSHDIEKDYTRHEFENGITSEYVEKKDDYFVSGGKYITGFVEEGDNVTVKFNADSSGKADMIIYYYKEKIGDLVLNITVNGVTQEVTLSEICVIDNTSAVATSKSIKLIFDVKSGENDIVIAYKSGGDLGLKLDSFDTKLTPKENTGCGSTVMFINELFIVCILCLMFKNKYVRLTKN